MSSTDKQSISSEELKNAALNFTHFISLPLVSHSRLVDQLVNFRTSVLGMHGPKPGEVSDSSSKKNATNEEDRNQKVLFSELRIDESIFIEPKTLHLTVLMLKLWDSKRIDAAVKILKGIEAEVREALGGQPVSVRLKGLDCMWPSPATARVLYAPVEVVGGEDRLLQACKVITDAFIKGGLAYEKDTKRPLKLHATVMNVSHRDRKKRTAYPDSFDARGIIEQFGSKEWGEYPISKVHLSQRFVFDKENGYYRCCASIPLPYNPQAD